VASVFSVVYFSFIGFDAPSTAAEDSRYPQRDLARSILVSLTIVSALYLAFTMSGGGFPLNRAGGSPCWACG
jgi:basic amino acid/polyamine antiporter, APA family